MPYLSNVRRLALGTVQFGLPYGIANKNGQVSRAVAKTMLSQACHHGIDTLDTAISYGESEDCLGEIGTQGFNLITKLPEIPTGCSDVSAWVIEQVNNSLRRLCVDKIYGLLLHRPEQLLGIDGELLYITLQELKEAGLVQKIGVSIYSPSELDQLLIKYRLDLVQAPFNLVDRRLHTSGWLHRLKQEDIEIHNRSVFLQGLLLMDQKAIPSKFAPWMKLLQNWHEWLALNNVTAVHACLSFSFSFPEIDRVVVGVDNIDQLEHIINAATCSSSLDLPDLSCDVQDLINPSRWTNL